MKRSLLSILMIVAVASFFGCGKKDDKKKAGGDTQAKTTTGTTGVANPCGGKAANPCGGKAANPCGGKAANPCGGKAANPCGGKAANPCGGGAIPAAARDLFKARCSVCHGESGKGDGVGAKALPVKPRNYTDAAWQKTVTDDHLKKVIVEGGASVKLSPLMTANPDLKGKPEIVDGLVKIIREFGAAK